MECVRKQCVCRRGTYLCNGKCIPKDTCCTRPDSCEGDNQYCPRDGGSCVCARGYYLCRNCCIRNDKCERKLSNQNAMLIVCFAWFQHQDALVGCR